MQRHTKRKELFGGVRNFPFHSAFHIELRKAMNLKYISGDLLKFIGATYPLGKAEPKLCQEDTLRLLPWENIRIQPLLPSPLVSRTV